MTCHEGAEAKIALRLEQTCRAAETERLQAQIVRLEAVIQAAQDVIDASLTLPNVAAMPKALRSPCAQLALTLARFYKALDTP